VEHTTPTIERAWLTYAQASEYTGIHRTTLWRAVRRNDLRAGGVGRAVRFERRELDRWMRGNEEK
jgi:excisionase family DNA binding protein